MSLPRRKNITQMAKFGEVEKREVHFEVDVFFPRLMAAFHKVEVLNADALKEDPSNLTIVLHEEDHTIGNSLKHILCMMEDVEFAGYNVPHPLEDKILIRLQTKKGVPAAPLLLKAFDHLESLFAGIRQKFENSYEEFKS